MNGQFNPRHNAKKPEAANKEEKVARSDWKLKSGPMRELREACRNGVVMPHWQEVRGDR